MTFLIILGAYCHLVFQNGPKSLPKIVYYKFFKLVIGLPRWLSSKESTCQCRRHRFDPWVWKNALEKEVATPQPRNGPPAPGPCPRNYSCLKIPRTEEPGVLQSMGSQESDMTECAHSQGIQEGDESSGAGRAGT